MLLDVRVFRLQGLDKRPGDPQALLLGEVFGALYPRRWAGDPFRLVFGPLQGASGRVENRSLVSGLGERPAYGGAQGRVVVASGLLRDALLERERRLAGPALYRPANNDYELLVPVAEYALPAVSEPLPDTPEEGAARGHAIGLVVVTKAGQLHRQDRKRPTLRELPAQDAAERRTVRQPRELVKPARGFPGVLQGRAYPPGEEPQGTLLLGAVLAAPDYHRPPLLVFVGAKGHGHEPFYPVDLLLAAHGVALAATLQHETLDRGMPPAGANVEVSLKERAVMVAFERGDVRVRPTCNRVGRLGGPSEHALQAQDLHCRPEPGDQPLIALNTVYLVCQGGGEPDGQFPETLHLGAQKRDDHAEERYEAGPRGHRDRFERTYTLRGDDRGRVPDHQRTRRHCDLRPRFDPGYPQRREEVEREERRARSSGVRDQHPDEHGVEKDAHEPLPHQDLGPPNDQGHPEEQREACRQVSAFSVGKREDQHQDDDPRQGHTYQTGYGRGYCRCCLDLVHSPASPPH